MKSAWLLVSVYAAALLGLALTAGARPIGYVAVKEMVRTLETEIATQPANPTLHYQLGRAHEIAAESGSETIWDVYRGSPGYHFYSHGGSYFDEAYGETFAGKAKLSTEDRKEHLVAAIAAYRKAVLLAPKDTVENPLTRLRLAGLLEKAGALAVDWKIEAPTSQPAPSAAERGQIEREVAQLGDDRIEARAAATAALRQHLEAALPTLEAHRQDADLEVRTRVTVLIDYAHRKVWYEQAATEYRTIVAMLQAPIPGKRDGEDLTLKDKGASWRPEPGQGQNDDARCIYEAALGLVRMLDATTPSATPNERDQTQAIADLLAQRFHVKPDLGPPE